LRLDHRALSGSDETTGCAAAPDDDTVVVRRGGGDAVFWIAARLRGAGTINLADVAYGMAETLDTSALDLVLDTEHAEFTSCPAAIDLAGPLVTFQRPGAVILRER
jgi:hypothetical protein